MGFFRPYFENIDFGHLFHAKGRPRNFPKIHFVTIMLTFSFLRKIICDQQPKSVAWGGKEKDS